MISDATKEAFFFYLGIATALLVAFGSTAVIIYMGAGFLWRLVH